MLSPTRNDPSLAFEFPEPLPLAKPGSVCIDLADLLSVTTLKTSYSLSTNDSVSVKADEETAKSIASAELEFAPVKKAKSARGANKKQEEKMTIKEIISKRAYTKRSNDNKNVANNSNQSALNKKKRLANLDGDAEEMIIKKEKLDNKEAKEIVVPQENKAIFPEVVFKDGKVQIVAPNFSDCVETVKQELQVVDTKQKKLTMSTSFKQMTHTEKWTQKETTKFYRALELFGTDFSMIAKVFKSRNRNQIKNKFLREEKIAPEKIDGTLKGARPTNFQVLFRKFEKLKKAQKSLETEDNNNKSINLLFPIQNTQQENKQEEGILICRTRNERSGSFCSTTSVDSMDRAIIEDLADILMPQKKLFGL